MFDNTRILRHILNIFHIYCLKIEKKRSDKKFFTARIFHIRELADVEKGGFSAAFPASCSRG